jgi:hypothetical protein
LAARRRLDSLERHVDHMVLAKLRLLVSELVNRAATADVDGRNIHVSVSISPKTIRAVVAQPGAKPRHGLDWALFLVERMADRWGLSSEVWFELDQPPKGRFRR